MSELPSVRRWKRESAWRGAQALVVGGVTTAAFVAGWPAWIGIAGLVGTGALVYRWFMWRARHGLRF